MKDELVKELCEILKDSKKIAVVGVSRNPEKISRQVADYLVRAGFEVAGVHPAASDFEDPGYPMYASLKDIPYKIDIVNVFRRSEDIPGIMPDVMEINPKSLWLQLGIKNDEAVEPAKAKGIKVVQNQCIKIIHNYCRNINQL